MDIEIQYKPKRLPRKLKKKFKNGDKNVSDKIEEKYPSFTLKKCVITNFGENERGEILDAMELDFNIRYEYFSHTINRTLNDTIQYI